MENLLNDLVEANLSEAVEMAEHVQRIDHLIKGIRFINNQREEMPNSNELKGALEWCSIVLDRHLDDTMKLMTSKLSDTHCD